MPTHDGVFCVYGRVPWQMLFFLLFLVYPSLSATILRLYICTTIEGTSYLVADMTVQCHTSTWNLAAGLASPTIVLYPIGIPVFFFVMLYRYRNRLEEAGVRAQLGFLYGTLTFYCRVDRKL